MLRPVLGDRLLLFTELPRRGLLGNSRVDLLSTTVLEVFVLFCPKGYANVIWISDVDQKEW